MHASLSRNDGVVKILIDGELYNPVAFRAFWPQAKTVRNFNDKGFIFQNVFPSGMINGIGLPYSNFGPVWEGERQYNWDNLDRQIALFLDNAPDAYLSVMVHLDTRPWFLEQHPECPNTFDYIVDAAGYEPWRQAALRYMCDMIDYLEEKYPDRFYALFLMAGGTTEWYTRRDDGQYHPLKEKFYKLWRKDDTLPLPLYEQLHNTGCGALRHPITNAQALDYWRFHSQSVADALCWFAQKARQYTRGTKLIGVYSSYLTGTSSGVVTRSYNTFNRIMNDNNIDIICSPASYKARELAQTSAFRLPVDSFILHGKIYIHEIDNVTSIANDNPYCQDYLRRLHARFKDLRDTIMYLRREVAMTMAKRLGYCWFDMFTGWYDNDQLMDELNAMRRATERLYGMNPKSVSQVAAFVDEESLYYPSFTCKLIDGTVEMQGFEFNRMGLPWDQYVLNNLHHPDIPVEQYRLMIFQNLYKPDQRTRHRIAQLRRQGISMLFLYASGYITDEGFSCEAMSELTGLTLSMKPSYPYTETDIIVPIGEYNTTGDPVQFGFEKPVLPLFYVNDKETDVIGRYSLSGEPAVAIKVKDGRFDAWSISGNIPGLLLKELARKAGAFVYSETSEPLYANSHMIGLFSHAGGSRTLRMPYGSRLVEMYSGQVYPVSKGIVEINFDQNEMKTFYIE